MTTPGRRRAMSSPTRNPRLLVTDRDRSLLEYLYRFRLLPRDQAMALAGFHSVTRANTRLASLAKTKLISRKTLPVLPGHGSAQTLYFLGLASVNVINVDASTVAAQIRQVSCWDTRQVAHVIAANAVIVNFLSAARRNPAIHVESFRTEPELRRLLLGRPLVPDGWIAWMERGRRYNVFLEVDLGTEGLRQWRGKVGEYLSYAESSLHPELFGFRSFRVAVLAKTRRRMESLRAMSGPADRFFLFAELSAITAETVLHNAWLPVAGGPLIKLAEAR